MLEFGRVLVRPVGLRVGRMLDFFFFKQKTAYEIVSRDWSSDVCSSDLLQVVTNLGDRALNV